MSAAPALACRQQQRVTFTVRRHEGASFVVVRELSGFDVQKVEEEASFGPFAGADRANDFAFRASESFMQQYPAFVAEVRPVPTAPGARRSDPFSEFESFHR